MCQSASSRLCRKLQVVMRETEEEGTAKCHDKLMLESPSMFSLPRAEKDNLDLQHASKRKILTVLIFNQIKRIQNLKQTIISDFQT